MPKTALLVLTPQAIAVDAAAESVMSLLAENVRIKPLTGSVSIQSLPSIPTAFCLAIAIWLNPIPSPIHKMIFSMVCPDG
jgi:hypothetical protein